MARIIKSGSGWRLGWDPSAGLGLVGNDDWAIELNQTEFQDFCYLLNQLQKTMQAMAEELMPEETITCDAETASVWMEATGYSDRYSIRFILNTNRRCEGFWPSKSVAELVVASQDLARLTGMPEPI